MRQMAGESLIFAYTLCAPEPTDPLNDCQPRRNFHPSYLGHENEMQGLCTYGILGVEQLTDPSTPWFGYIVFD